MLRLQFSLFLLHLATLIYLAARKGFMLLYWGMFTLGFFAGSILAFVVFASKEPEDEMEYRQQTINSLQTTSAN